MFSLMVADFIFHFDVLTVLENIWHQAVLPGHDF